MLLSLSIILGFKAEVADVAYRQTGHISIYHYGEPWTGTSRFITFAPDTQAYLESQSEVEHCDALIQQMALLKTEDNFSGLMICGVEEDFALPQSTQGKSIPTLQRSDSLGNPLVLPLAVADNMGLKRGDKLRLYFMGEGIKVRSFYLADTYQSGGLETMPAFCSAEVLRKLLRLQAHEYSRIRLWLKPEYSSTTLADALPKRLGEQKHLQTNHYSISTAEELLPDLFSWLSLLDSNVIFLIVIMLLISIFTMITGVIILVLDKTRHIAILKALGASNSFIRSIFRLVSVRLILWGLLWGNLLALALLFMQKHWAVLRLNPRDYFIDTVPVALDIWIFVVVNIGALLLISLAIFLPLGAINSVRPSRLLRFD